MAHAYEYRSNMVGAITARSKELGRLIIMVTSCKKIAAEAGKKGEHFQITTHIYGQIELWGPILDHFCFIH